MTTVTTQFNRAKRLAEGEPSSPDTSPYADDPIVKLARQAMAKVVSDVRKDADAQAPMAQVPSSDIAEMATALADTDPRRAEDMVAELLDGGVGVQDLCLDHLAPAARELGVWWERDTMPFADVTMAAARIQSILRTIPKIRPNVPGEAGHGALFASVPGETHTLGVIMAADHFRRLGWDIGLLVGMTQDELCRKIANDDRALVGLSCAGRHGAKALCDLIDAIRECRSDVAIIVSGHGLNDPAVMAQLPKVDGLVRGLDGAEEVLLKAVQDVPVQASVS